MMPRSAHQAVAAIVPTGTDATEALTRSVFAAAAWSAIPEPGDGDAGLVRAVLGDERALELLVEQRGVTAWLDEVGDDAAALSKRLGAALERWRPRVDLARVERALLQARRWNQVILTPQMSEWPHAFDDLGIHAPAALWVRGRLEVLATASRSVALVGSRAASGYGEHIAMELVDGLVRAGFATVSGAAYGIDAAVHRATLACGGATIAVMAGGLDRLYPPGNEALLGQVEQRGVLIAELPSGASPSRWRFLQRNRVIAALGSATVVVEASVRSGSINTAGHAATLGRPLAAVPGPVTSGSSAGCHRLIREYDATLVQSAAEIRELIDGAQSVLEQRLGGASAEETRVLDALSARQVRGVDDVAMRSGMAPGDVQAALGVLELSGAVRERGGGWVRA